MGFEVFLSSYRDGKPQGIPRQQWIDAFGGFVRDEDTDVWLVRYDESNWCSIYIAPEAEERDCIAADTIASAMVERPCSDRRLWDSLFAIMQLGNVVLYYPGGLSALAASEHVAAHLPEGMADALGCVVALASGEELAEYIRRH